MDDSMNRHVRRFVPAAALLLAVHREPQHWQPIVAVIVSSGRLLWLEDLIAVAMIGLTAAVLLHGMVEAVRERLSAE